MSLGNDLLQIASNEKITEAVCDIAEVPLDGAIDFGAVKDLPFLGTVFKICSGVISVRERLFLQKVARFLRTLRLVSEYDKQQFLMDLDKEGMRQKVGEKLIMLIERQDDLEKAELLGVIFESYVKRAIDRPTFESLSHAITMAHLPDLMIFKEQHVSPLLSRERGAAFLATGLSILKVGERYDNSGKVEYQYSILGYRLRELLVAYYKT